MTFQKNTFLFNFLLVSIFCFAFFFFFDVVKADSVDLQSQSSKETQEIQKKAKFKAGLRKILKGKSMEKMVDALAEKDQKVAAFLVGIAFKESGFGKFGITKNGKECYNFWGYKGNVNPNKYGYSCFSSPEEAVNVVGGRIERLIAAGAKSPAKMTVWKCGYSCKSHSKESVNSWIRSVSYYYNKVNAL